jgi:trimeric autotransporter adhesin
VGRILKDWSFSGGITAGSGTPLTARVLGAASDGAGTGAAGSGRADSTGLPLYAGGGFFNLAAFAIPPAGRYGNAGRNTIDGPARISANLSVSRSFRIDDRRRMELRVESRNFTNHVSFTRVGTVVNASDYGLATATAPMRSVSANLRVRF